MCTRKLKKTVLRPNLNWVVREDLSQEMPLKLRHEEELTKDKKCDQ